MGLTDEFNEGRKWVQESFKFNSKTDVSVFETVIRFVGGFIAGTLLYSFHLCCNPMTLMLLIVTLESWNNVGR